MIFASTKLCKQIQKQNFKKAFRCYLPQIFIGEDNSKNTGCSARTSFALTQSHFISFSRRFICLNFLIFKKNLPWDIH